MNSFLQGKKTLSAAPLRPVALPGHTPIASAAHAKVVERPAAHAGHDHPTVEVVKEGDKVVRLIVNCSCGERVEIECLYPGA